jgi:hypothetical protein
MTTDWMVGYTVTSPIVEAALVQAVVLGGRLPREIIFHTDRGSTGGFNWLSQHLVVLEVLYGSSSTVGGSGSASEDAFAGPVGVPQTGGGRVLASDWAGAKNRGGCWEYRRVCSGGGPVV